MHDDEGLLAAYESTMDMVDSYERENVRLRAENERLLEEAFDMGVDMTAMRDENQRLRAALKECADDLETEINTRYCGTLDDPTMQARYERDMGVVLRAREALEATETNQGGKDEDTAEVRAPEG